MKKLIITNLILILISPLVLSAEKQKKSVYLELFSGFSLINPADLNLISEYNTNFYNDCYNKYKNIEKGYKITEAQKIEGGFKPIKNTLAMGGRVKFYLGKRGEYAQKEQKLAFSVGMKYLQTSVNSGASLTYSSDDFYVGTYTVTLQTDPLNLWIEAFVPQIGLHYSLANIKKTKIEVYLAGGIIFAKCGSFKQYLYERSEDSGYVRSLETIQDYDGRGSGLTLEGGIKLQINIFKSIGVFFEGGYSFQKVNKVSGEAFYKKNVKDNNGDGHSQSSNWQGNWILLEYDLGKIPGVDWKGMDTSNTNFKLNLSEFYLRVGLVIELF